MVFINKEKKQIDSVSVAKFKECVKTTMSFIRNYEDVEACLVECLETTNLEGEKEVTCQRFKLLLDFIKCFPTISRRDKNASNGMLFVLQNQPNAEKVHHADKEAPQVAKKGEGKAVTERPVVQDQKKVDDRYVEQLCELVMTRLVEKFRSKNDMFREMDTKGKGKVSKRDFLAAVEKARVSLSKDDISKVFTNIDKSGMGYITYLDLCNAAARSPILDPRN